MAQQNLNTDHSHPWTGIETGVMALGLVWAVGWIGFCVFAAYGSETGFDLRVADVLLGILPALFAWAWADQAAKHRATVRRLDRHAERIAKLSHKVKALAEAGAPEEPSPSLMEKINQIASAQKRSDETLAVFLSSRATEAKEAAQPLRLENAVPVDHQPSLLLATPSAPDAPLSAEDFIRAANFPKTPEDRVGFAVMKLAMRSEQTSGFINSAQDILTLLSQEGVYMDDLHADPARVEVWRNFAKGQRGRDIAPLGGIRDRQILEKVATRMREDQVFRDAVHHFLRKFDFAFTAFGETASEDEILAFADTRSARAFMLLGRIAGTFD